MCASFAGFDHRRCVAHGFTFAPERDAGAPPHAVRVRLPGMGPKLLLSAASTATQPVLHWKLQMLGNNSFELACLPDQAALLDDARAVHKCSKGAGGATAIGFHSASTAGSSMSHSVYVPRGACIEVLARRGLLRIIVTAPSASGEEEEEEEEEPPQTGARQRTDGLAGHLASVFAASRVHRLELPFSDAYDVRLAATAWHQAELLFTVPFGFRARPGGAGGRRRARGGASRSGVTRAASSAWGSRA